MSTLLKVFDLLNNKLKKQVLYILLLTLLSMFFETIGIGLFIPAIVLLTEVNIAAKYPQIVPVLNFLGNPNQRELVGIGMSVLVGVYFLKNIFIAYFTYAQTRFANEIQVQLSQRLFATYLRQPYAFHLQRNSAHLIRNVTNEINQVQVYITQVLLLCTEFSVVLGIGILLVFSEPLGVLIVGIVLSGMSWIFNYFTKKPILKWAELRLYHSGQAIQHIMQGLGGAKDVKLLGRESDFLTQYKLHNIANARINRLNNTLLSLPRLWLELLMVIGLAILVLTMMAQDRALSTIVPTLGLFAIAAFRLLPSVNRILNTYQSMRFGTPSILLIFDELKLESNDNTILKIDATSKIDFTSLNLQNITFSYASTITPIIRNISLSIKVGEKVGFIGTSGSGKSTLIDIMLGLLLPDEGKISVDGIDIHASGSTIRGWQNQIGYVSQTIYLTDDTLSRNVAFGLGIDQIDDNAVQRAVKAAQLDEFVNSLPDGLKTVVGERGVRLSGGQRQRIGIARALYHEPQILVLDEATSSLDNDTEQGVIEAIKMLKEKTVIIVAHRLSTVAHCDRIFRIGKGKLIEQGIANDILFTK
jgi:ABC-type multidrug transport system fused ATPase/permease subunit